MGAFVLVNFVLRVSTLSDPPTMIISRTVVLFELLIHPDANHERSRTCCSFPCSMSIVELIVVGKYTSVKNCLEEEKRRNRDGESKRR